MIDLTPLDVRNKRGDFKKKLGGGYDPAEVDVFLELAADRLEPGLALEAVGVLVRVALPAVPERLLPAVVEAEDGAQFLLRLDGLYPGIPYTFEIRIFHVRINANRADAIDIFAGLVVREDLEIGPGCAAYDGE